MQELLRRNTWGYPVHTSSDECIKFIDEYYYQVLSYGSSSTRVILQAVEEDKNCALANALAAWSLMSVEPAQSQKYLEHSKREAEEATDYEKSVVHALVMSSKGHVEEALSIHSDLLEEFPRDLVTLKRGQGLAFSKGKSEAMLKLASQALHSNINHPYMHGMMAFALAEVGRIDEADTAARKAISIEKHDVWAQHALCHVLQERQQFQRAIDFMEDSKETWEKCGWLYAHNWWHLAVCYMDCKKKGSVETALHVFDTRIWGDRELEKDIFVDSLELLLSIELRGFGDCLGDRVFQVATQFLDESNWHQDWLLDLLIIWSLARSSHHVKARRLVSSLTQRIHLLCSNGNVQKDVLSLAWALYEYGLGNHKAVSSLLGSEFDAYELKVFAASNLQMKVFDQLWSKTKG